MADELKKVGLEFKANGTVDFKKALSEVNSAINENRSSFKLAKSEWDESTKTLKKLQDQQEYYARQTEAYSDKVQQLAEILSDLENAENRNELAISKTRQQLDNAKASLNYYERALEKTNKEIDSGTANLKDFAEKLDKIGEKADKAGKTLSKTVTAPIMAVGTASFVSATKFEDAMAKVSTIADTTKVPLEDLADQIMELSDETGIAGTEIAENVYNAISAGQDTADAVSFVAASTKLAAAGFADSGDSLDILTTIMNAYKKDASEVTKVSDVLIQTQNLGKTTVGELASSMGKIIPTANANNVALEQVSAGYAILTANGIATAESTTYMNSMLNELGKSGTKVSNTLKEQTGKSFSELMQEGMSLSDVLEIINRSAKQQGLSFGDLWGSSEAAKAGITLLGDSAENFNETLGKMYAASGATEEGFNKLDTTSKKAKIALNQIKNAGVDLGGVMLESVAPIISDICELVKNFTQWFKELDDGTKQTIITIAAIVAAIGPLLIFIGKVCSGASAVIGIVTKIIPLVSRGASAVIGIVTKIIPLMGSLNAVLAANPIILIVAAIAALVLAFIYLWNNCEEFRNFWINLWDKIRETFKAVVESVAEKIDSVKERISSFVESIKEKIGAARDFIKSAVEKIKKFFKFKIELPKIKLPHFSLKGKFSLNPISVPKIAVDWYAKGGILNKPTIFGQKDGHLLGGGEAGPEAVLPLSILKDFLRDEGRMSNEELMQALREVMPEVLYAAFVKALAAMKLNIEMDKEKFGELVSDVLRREVFA